MPNFSLRAYLQRIEFWIEENKIDKAISQSSYLLQQFPKNLNTFQVLSKALLQKQDFNYAEKVFDIILQIEPDDFVSHIGKSIIAEFNHSMDSAIEHMKFAFEAQPANEGLQNELKRLLLASDGVEPKKIHLTRGALIKMYHKGKLYQQAISEAKIGISESPQRIDYKIAMAKSFFEAGDLIQAVETCVEIISQLPYCLPANQILDQVLSKNHTINNNGFYHNRLIEIDPYYAFMLASTKSVFDVPDIAVMVEDYSEDESINYDLEMIISAAEINKVELEGAENVPASFTDWDSIINNGIESPNDNKSSTEENNAQDKIGLMNHSQSDKLANLRKKNFRDRLRISKSPAEDLRDVPDWFFDENGEINQKDFEFGFLESEDLTEEVSLESDDEALESNSSETGVFDTDVVPAVNDKDDLEMSNTLWINDEEYPMHEPFQKPDIALEDTQQISLLKETPSDLLIDSAKALEGGNTKFAFTTLSKLISENQNLTEIINQLERAIELYPDRSEFRLLLGETYFAMGEKEKSLAILQNAQKNISL
jgi:tetratricopeptide (TPR) repeat protein